MSALHPTRELHLIVAFPSDPAFQEMRLCYSAFAMQTDWITVTTEKNLDREALNCEENSILFFGSIPPWLPLKTNAVICLYFMGYAVTNPKDDERMCRNFTEWKKSSVRANVVFTRTSNQLSSLCDYSRHVIHLPNAFYHPSVMGVPVFSEGVGKPVSKKFSVVSYGDSSGRRGKIISLLMEHMPKGFYVHINNPSTEGRRKLLAESKAVLAIRACDGDRSMDPFLPIEAASSSAALIIEDSCTDPFDDGEEQCYRINAIDDYPKDMADKLVYLACRDQDMLRMAKRAHSKLFNNLSIQRFMDQVTNYSKSETW